MASNGNLNFTNVNKVTFEGVGSAPNAVIDTTTGKIGVGVDDPDANLHVVGNCFVSTNLELGGTLIMGTVNVEARHTLSAITATGNLTPHTVEFTNATTGLVTAGNVSVGGELTVGGDVNMLHTSNTASLKLNSNVVTEFPRSKKLIKYPRVAMTSATTGGYTATASGEESATRQVENLFNNLKSESGGGWRSNTGYNSSGVYTGSSNLGSDSGGTAFANADKGEWVKIELPHKIQLNSFTLTPRLSTSVPSGSALSYGRAEFIKNGKIWGSLNGTSWNVVHTISGSSASSDTVTNSYTVSSSTAYNYFALVVTNTNSGLAGIVGTSLSEWELYGTPENDPEADGVDVVVKSLPNVPNTDWLEVYYDAKNYTSGVVQDETTNNRDAEMNATFDNGTIKAFNFTGAYTSNVTTSDHGLGTGDVTYTVSYWFKRIQQRNNYDYLYMMGNGGTTGQASLMWILNDQLYLDHWGTATRYNEPIQNNRWYHVTVGHKGGQAVTNDFLYIDGQNVGVGVSTPATFNLQGAKLTLGTSHSTTNEFLEGSIANFRVFNRALTQDEIYQLYTYQKEYFGHGDLSMTLKAGRLGIGTSEPRAALDVRGDIRTSGLVNNVGMHWFISDPTGGNVAYTLNGGNWFSSTASSTVYGTVIRMENNAPISAWDYVTGYFTAPEDGLYLIDLSIFINGFDVNRWGEFQLLHTDGTIKERQYTFYTADLSADDTVGYSKTVYMKTGEKFSFYTGQGTVTLFLSGGPPGHTTMNVYKIS